MVDGSLSLKVGSGDTNGTEDSIHLLEGKLLGLWDKEGDKESTHEGEETEENVSSVLQILKHIWSDLTDDKVAHPVGRSTESDTLSTVGKWPDLSNQNPGTWSPGVTKVDNEEPDHGDGSPSSSLVGVPSVLELTEDDSNDEMAKSHTDGTGDENWLATSFVDPKNSWNSGDEHDDTDDTGRKEGGGVGILTELLENAWCVVENSVDTSELLEEHSDGGNNHTLEHWPGGEERTKVESLKLDGSSPVATLRKLWELALQSALLEEGLRLNLKEFERNELVVLWKGTKGSESVDGILLTTVMAQPTWRERHEDHTNTKKNSRSKLKSQRNEPSSIFLGLTSSTNVIGSVINPSNMLAGFGTKKNICLLTRKKS